LEDEESIDTRSLIWPTSSGCVGVFVSAIASCVLLFLNGGVVMAILNALDDQNWALFRDDQLSQFSVLIGPVIMLVIQWRMIDYLRDHLTPSEKSTPHTNRPDTNRPHR